MGAQKQLSAGLNGLLNNDIEIINVLYLITTNIKNIHNTNNLQNDNMDLKDPKSHVTSSVIWVENQRTVQLLKIIDGKNIPI